MESKANCVICGTCAYWNGRREELTDKRGNPKIAIFDETGICECPISSKSGEVRKKDLYCKEYMQWYDPTRNHN